MQISLGYQDKFDGAFAKLVKYIESNDEMNNVMIPITPGKTGNS